jgi:hypothetical protein
MSIISNIFNFSEVGWFKRHTAIQAHPSLQVQEGTNGTLNFKLSEGIKTTEKTISLGEEHSETLPNGESTRVSFFNAELLKSLLRAKSAIEVLGK